MLAGCSGSTDGDWRARVDGEAVVVLDRVDARAVELGDKGADAVCR
jgi:hypothetical protein